MRVLTMAKAFHAASGLPFQFSAPHADALFRSSLTDPDRACLVYDVSGIARGVLAAQAGAHQFAAIKVASEIMWWIDPNNRGSVALKMLAAYEDWARDRGCAFAAMVGLGSDPAVGALYERRGYQPAERHFMKSL
ncbi:GNAT family N-acetyltransferase [Neorhizobium sp. P12A]|uniref:GNAT family N-acetyltransferase n=1 Tax=Neorhizobium sp. P12A TaxID=2268027 RepID=UPI0011ED8B0E|nr:GNAT family N-acetyltransferase [Neorhizobium sp. P12A]